MPRCSAGFSAGFGGGAKGLGAALAVVWADWGALKGALAVEACDDNPDEGAEVLSGLVKLNVGFLELLS